jgi:aminoglycoside phosphotransferase (APT) family kinase protein
LHSARLAGGKEAEVFEYGSRVVKLYPPGARKEAAFREAAILAGLEGTGVPAPPVWGVAQFEQRWGLIMDRATGVSFAERMKQDHSAIPACLEQMARLHLRIHRHKPVRLADMTTRLASNICDAATLDPVLRTTLLQRLRGFVGGDRLCHGDFHPENIIGEPAEANVIDWLDASRGDPAADVCRSYLLLHLHAPDLAMAYVDTHCRVSGTDRQRVLHWLPFIAAARLSENVSDEVPRLLELCRVSN